LKHHGKNKSSRRGNTINRTFEELKLKGLVKLQSSLISINRTCEELKHAPVRFPLSALPPINRTFEELKPI